MSSDLKLYYENYYRNNGYTAQTEAEGSRMLQIIDWFNQYVPVKGSIPIKVLDVGCGDMTPAIKLPQYQWTGIDINTEMAQGEAIVQDLMVTPYPFKDNAFNAVLCSETLEHVWDPRVIHKEAYRVLIPGGYYLISTPNMDWIEHKLENYQRLVYNHHSPWTQEHIRQYGFLTHEYYLKEAGFEIVDFTGADPQHGYFFSNANRVLKQLIAHKLKHSEYLADGKIDQIVGRMFPVFSHTIMILGRKK